jgi:hypothetical protein
MNIRELTSTIKTSHASFQQGVNSGIKSYVHAKDVEIPEGETVTIPATCDVSLFQRGAIFKGSGKIIIGKMSADPLHQIFGPDLEVEFLPGAVKHYRPKWMGSVEDGVTNDYSAIQKTIDSIPVIAGGKILISNKCATESELSVAKRGIFFEGEKPANEPNGVADADSMSQIIYTGTLDNTKAVIRVAATSHNFSIHNIFINSNDLAGFGLYQVGDPTPLLTRGGSVDSVAFRGYRVAAWVVGDHTDVLNAAQFQQITARNIWMRGGAVNANANGLHINAQNCEWVTIVGFYIDPPSANRHHTNHIRQISGGLNITSLLSTRAGTTTLLDGYAIYSNDQLVLNGWRSEDRFLLQFASSAIKAPSIISGVAQRPDETPDPGYGEIAQPTDPVIDIGASTGPITLSGIRTNGSIRIGATNPITVNCFGISFSRKSEGAGFIYSGPRNQRGIYHDVIDGDLALQGVSPGIDLVAADGASMFSVKDGSLSLPRVNLAEITETKNNFDIGDGTFFRVSTDAARAITGLSGGTNGRAIYIVQTSAYTLTIANNTGSDAANRILTGDGRNILLSQGEMAFLYYDITSFRWRAVKLTNQSGYITGDLTVTGKVQGSGVVFGEGGSFEGMGFYTGVNGIAIRGKTGTTNDFNIRAADDNFALVIPTGTRDISLPAATDATALSTGALWAAGGASFSKRIITGTDFKAITAGKGVVLTNAAGTVTKRVRLSDAGDGLVFEDE